MHEGMHNGSRFALGPNLNLSDQLLGHQGRRARAHESKIQIGGRFVVGGRFRGLERHLKKIGRLVAVRADQGDQSSPRCCPDKEEAAPSPQLRRIAAVRVSTKTRGAENGAAIVILGSVMCPF